MSEKEYLVDIFQRLYRKYADKLDSPDPNENGFFEMKKAANEYASSLLPLGDQWKAAVEYDVKKLNDHHTIPPSIRYNKDKLEKFKGEVFLFLGDIKNSLRHHGFDIMELPKDTLAYMGEEAFIIDKQTKKYVSIHPKELKSIREQRKTARKTPKALTPATAGSIIQNQPGTSTADTQPKPEDTAIFTDCIANDYRDEQTTIEAELKKVLANKKGKAAIIVFVACYYHGLLRQCPSHQQAFELSKSIGTGHKGYNDQKKKYFEESEEGTRIYNVLIQSKLDIIREEIIKAEAELKPLFDKLKEPITPATDGTSGDQAGHPATHQHKR